MRYTTFLALRFIFSLRKETSVTIFSALSVLGIAISVMTLIIVISVMNGFERDLKAKIIGFNAHVSVSGQSVPLEGWQELSRRIEKIPEVKAVSPYGAGEIMARVKDRIFGLYLRGIEPSLEDKTSDVLRSVASGSSDLSADDAMLIGSEFARSTGLRVSDKVTLIAPTDIYTPFGRAPRIVKARVSGIFKSGMSDFDYSVGFVNLRLIQKMYRLGESVHGLSVSVKNVEQAFVVKNKILALQKENGQPLEVKTWVEKNLTLFRAVRTEKNVMFLILTMAVAVAAINIISSLIMLVMNKTKEIGIFRSIGMRRAGVLSIFFKISLILSLIGTVLGLVCGIIFVLKINAVSAVISHFTGFELFPKDIYYFDAIPTQMRLFDVLKICFFSIALSLAAGLYPSWKASRLEPAQVLRYQ